MKLPIRTLAVACSLAGAGCWNAPIPLIGETVPDQEECPPGRSGCSCTDAGHCEAGLECIDHVCGVSPETAGDGDGDGDGTPDLPLGECDAFAQDCPAGEKCVPVKIDSEDWNSTRCVAVLGDKVAAEPCTLDDPNGGTDDCDAGSICWDVADVDGEIVGRCASFCAGTPENPECAGPLSFFVSCCVAICAPRCDVLEQDCVADAQCYWSGDEFNCFVTTQKQPRGAPCEVDGECDAGLFCADAATLTDCDSGGCCSEFCDLNDPTCEAPGTECLPFFSGPEASAWFDHLGGCTLPP